MVDFFYEMQGARKMHEIPVKMRTEWRVNSVHDYLGIRRIASIASPSPIHPTAWRRRVSSLEQQELKKERKKNNIHIYIHRIREPCCTLS